LVLAIVNSEPRKPRELRPEIPAEIERVVLHAMGRQRSQRLQTIDALIAALVPFSGARTSDASSLPRSLAPVRANTTQPGTRLGERGSPESKRRLRVRGLSAAATLATLLLALAWWWSSDDQATDVPAASPATPRESPSASSIAGPVRARSEPTLESASVAEDPPHAGQPATTTETHSEPTSESTNAAATGPSPARETPARKSAQAATPRTRELPTKGSPAAPVATQPTQQPHRARAGQIRIDDL
jgi:serine/threonine-protein kinase